MKSAGGRDGAPGNGDGDDRAAEAAAPAVELRDVWFAYGRTPVLEAVDLTVPRGAFLGVIGPNGAGKTTLFKLILGLHEPDRGRIRVLGGSPAEARGRVGYVPQFARFDPDFPVRVRDVVLMGRLGRSRPVLGYREEDRDAARSALDQMELGELSGRHVGELSGGQLQRTLIARALAMEPAILLLDEPTAAVDSRIGASLYDLLHALTRRMTVILVTHDVGVVSREVESVACLNRRLYYHGSEEVSPEVLEAAYGGEVDMVTHGDATRLLRGHGGS